MLLINISNEIYFHYYLFLIYIYFFFVLLFYYNFVSFLFFYCFIFFLFFYFDLHKSAFYTLANAFNYIPYICRYEYANELLNEKNEWLVYKLIFFFCVCVLFCCCFYKLLMQTISWYQICGFCLLYVWMYVSMVCRYACYCK